MKNRLLALSMLSALWPSLVGAAPAAVTKEQQRDVMVTIYNGNLGLVKDTREVRLGPGTIEVQFADVAAQIDPTSVHLKSLSDPAGLKIHEQNYEYDLLTSEKLLEKFVGRTVRVYQSNGSFQEATLLSTKGPVYSMNGQIHTGFQGHVVFPALPENLVSKPTLVWLLRNATATAQRIEASYLTAGINWKADYVMVIDPTDARSDLTGWVTIENKSGASYANAALKLVAGDVNRAVSRDLRLGHEALAARPAPPADASREFKSEGFFEYHLYSLDGRTTIKDNQTKQLTLLSAHGVSLDKRFIFYGAQHVHRAPTGLVIANQKVGVYLELQNSKANRLGIPLPKGKVRVYKADTAGSHQLIGEDWIDHTPEDERVKIKMGHAFDVIGERAQKEWRKLGSNLYEVEWEISLRNHKKENITVEVVEPMPGDWEVLRSTLPHEKVDASTARFRVPVPRQGEAKLTYRARLQW